MNSNSIRLRRYSVGIIILLIFILTSFVTIISLLAQTQGSSLRGSVTLAIDDNLIENPSFEEQSDYHPWPWWRQNCRIYSYSSSLAPDGNRYCKASYIQNNQFNVHQTIEGGITADTTYYASTWVRLRYGSAYLRYRISTGIYNYYSSWVSITANNQGYYLDEQSIYIGHLTGSSATFYIEVVIYSINYFYFDDVQLIGTGGGSAGVIDVEWERQGLAHEVAGTANRCIVEIDVSGYWYHDVLAKNIDTEDWIDYPSFSYRSCTQHVEYMPIRIAALRNHPFFPSHYPQPWIVSDSGHIYQLVLETERSFRFWECPGGLLARDIAADAVDNIWVISRNGRSLFKWEYDPIPEFGEWVWIEDLPFEATSLGVAYTDHPQVWVVATDGRIWERVLINPNQGLYQWETRSTDGNKAHDIACQPNSVSDPAIWIVEYGAEHTTEGGDIFRWNRDKNEWDVVREGVAIRIGVDADGNPWIIRNLDRPMQYRGTVVSTSRSSILTTTLSPISTLKTSGYSGLQQSLEASLLNKRIVDLPSIPISWDEQEDVSYNMDVVDVDFNAQGNLYALCQRSYWINYLYKWTTDSGWEQVTQFPSSVDTMPVSIGVGVDRYGRDVVFIATDKGKVYEMRSGGSSWRERSGILVRDIDIEPDDDEVYAIGYQTHSIYKWTGRYWYVWSEVPDNVDGLPYRLDVDYQERIWIVTSSSFYWGVYCVEDTPWGPYFGWTELEGTKMSGFDISVQPNNDQTPYVFITGFYASGFNVLWQEYPLWRWDEGVGEWAEVWYPDDQNQYYVDWAVRVTIDPEGLPWRVNRASGTVFRGLVR